MKSAVDELNACGTIICSYFVESHFCYFYEDGECCLHILQKTSNEHIKLTPYSKMNLELPAQVLSSVSKVLLSYGPSEVVETSSFVH